MEILSISLLNINLSVMLVFWLFRKREKKKVRTIKLSTLIVMATEIIQIPPFYSHRYPCFQLENSKDLYKGKMNSRMLI